MTDGESPGLVYLTPSPGEIEQQGTPQSATNFGNMDYGILENALMNDFNNLEINHNEQAIKDLQGQTILVNMTNTLPFPASNSEQTVVFDYYPNNTNYKLSYEVVSKTGGYVDSVEFYDKAYNGFKVKYYGSATAVTLKIYAVGGLY